jgi:CheY-like chemotaxis protein
MNRILIAHHLEKEGYAVVQCASGEEALAMLDRRPLPALVLLDVLMGATSGLEVCRHIKQSASTSVIPVVLLTALESKEDRMRGMQAGADDLLTKPVTRGALLERVSRLLPARTSARD